MAKSNFDAIQGFLAKNDRRLMAEILNDLEIVNHMDTYGSVIRNLRTEMNLNKLTVGAGVRPLNTDIEDAKHQRVWSNRSIKPRYGMKIFHIDPDDALGSYYSEMAKPGAKREIFAAWQWQQEFNRLKAELNDNAYFQEFKADAGDWASGSTYTAGDVVFFATDKIFYKCVSNTSAGESPATHAAKWEDVDNQVLFDGLGTILAAELAASNGWDAVSTGSYDHTNAVEAYRDVWGSFPEAFKRSGGRKVIFVSFDSFEDYVDDYNNRFGTGKGIGGVDLNEAQAVPLRNSAGRCLVVPATWMGTSRRIICTSTNNLTIGFDQAGDPTRVAKTIETLHGYKSIVKFTMSFQIRDLAQIAVNDQV